MLVDVYGLAFITEKWVLRYTNASKTTNNRFHAVSVINHIMRADSSAFN